MTPIFLLVLGLFWLSCDRKVLVQNKDEKGVLLESYSLIDRGEKGWYKQGTHQQWYPSGRLFSEVQYHLGNIHGKFTTYHENGAVNYQASYDEGYLLEEMYRNPQGKILIQNKFTLVENEHSPKKGKKQLKEKYTLLKSTQTLGIKHGLYKSWYSNGKPKIHGQYIQGELSGVVSEWYENGNLKEKCVYMNSVKHGNCNLYFPTGKIWKNQTFTFGVLEGPLKQWHPNGKLEETVAYKKGKKDGLGKLYYDNGNLKRQGYYSQGLLQGEAWKYYPNGKPWVMAHYRNDTLEGKYEWWTFEGQKISERMYVQGHLSHDSRMASLKKNILETEVSVPLEYLGFFWGMKVSEAKSLISLLPATILKASLQEITFYYQDHPSSTSQRITLEFCQSQELWRIQTTFENKEENRLSYYSDSLANYFQVSFPLPKLTKNLEGIPGIWTQSISWGQYRVQPSDQPENIISYPAVQAELYQYQEKPWVSFSLACPLIKAYSDEQQAILSGPFWENTTPIHIASSE